MLDGRIGNFINTYNAQRDEFNRNNYLSKENSWYRKFHFPFAEWNSFSMLEEENIFFANMVDKVKNSCIPEKSLSITVLSLKNRIEYLSEHVDFLTLYITYTILLFSFFRILGSYFNIIKENNFIKSNKELIAMDNYDLFIVSIYELIIPIICIILVTFFSIEKFRTRKEVMYKKEIINIFEKCISENKN